MPATRQLPGGTVTFLFSDIEGSTRLLQELGPRYSDVLTTHYGLLRAAFAEHGGQELGTEGDAVFAVFPSATGAVASCATAQRALAGYPWPDGLTVRVRMGVHTGEATLVGEDYVGLDVHRAARIAAVAQGGQVLVSDAVRILVENALPVGVGLRDLGEHRLKDLARPERLHQLDIAGLRSEFPPPQTLDATPNNLPTQLTSFIGREAELREGTRLLGRTRLLTLTGPGGTGKTRLSLQLAAEAAAGFPHGVYFVPLAPVRDPELLASVILQTVGVHDTGMRPPLERLVDHLRERQVLLLLDNFEQLLGAAPTVIGLLKGGPSLKIVVTSRAALRVSGEQEFPVPPLRLPDPKALPGLEALSQYEAVRLFIERAVAVKPDFQVTNENAPAVAGICDRLDGLPLAIELAAARAKLFSPQAMLTRLQRRLTVLGAGARDLPGRQQTLRGAIAWSYDLLDEGGKRLFGRFAVFERGGSLEQAEAVCGPAQEVGGEVLDGLAALADQSLLRQEPLLEEPRFLMLQTIREFALERLAETPDAGDIARRHAAAFLALAERAQPELTGPRQKGWLDRLEREHDNLRAALDWAIAGDEAETAMGLVAALWRFWQMRGHLHEARHKSDRVLALRHSQDHPQGRMRALEAAGGIAYWQGDLTAAQASYEECLALSRQVGDRASVANALYNFAFPLTVSKLDLPRAHALLQECLELYRKLDDRAGVAKSLWAIGNIYYFREDYAAAQPMLEESLAHFRNLDDPFGLGWTLHTLGLVYVRTANLVKARGVWEESLMLFAAAEDVSGVVLLLDDCSQLAAAEGDRERAIRLAGAAAALTASSGVGLSAVINEIEQRFPSQQRLSNAAAAAAWAEGQSMNMARAIADALRQPQPKSG